MSHTLELFSSPLLRVTDEICTSGKCGACAPKAKPSTYVMLLRRGCFDYHLGSRTFLADAASAFIYDEGAEYSASHPCDGGDDLIKLEPDAATFEELFAGRRRNQDVALRMTAQAQLVHFRAYAVLGGDRADILAKQEAGLRLLQTVARQPAIVQAAGPVARRQRRMVDAAKGFMDERLARNLDLAEVARAAGCSPYHLMRLFRADTGQSLRSYRARMRVVAAMDLLCAGAEDLTQIALDVGFASHSHLTDTFRAVLGASPSQLRAEIGESGLIERRRWLEAGMRSAA